MARAVARRTLAGRRRIARSVEADYGPVVDGTEPAEVFVLLRDGEPFGLIQRFRLAAYPHHVEDLQPLLVVPPEAWNIEYFVGEQADTGRGLGSEMIRAFTAAIWSNAPDAISIIVPVQAGNVASWHALEKKRAIRAPRQASCSQTTQQTAAIAIFIQ